MPAKPPLWRCPKCGHTFVTRNLSHSCVRVPLAAHFQGRPPSRKRTWDRWLAVARACGPVVAYAQKTRIVIQARVRFAGAVVRGSYLDGNLWLRRVEDFQPLGFVHHFRLEQPSDIDAALEALMQEAYRVGTQESTRRHPII